MNNLIKYLFNLKLWLVTTGFFQIFNLPAQEPLKFSGNVSEAGTNDSLKDVNMKIYNSKNLFVKKVKTNEHGNYRFSLSTMTSDVYSIRISKEGYVTKCFQVSTENIPQKYRGTAFPVIQADLFLFNPVKGVNYSALKAPMLRYLYDSIKDNYVYDKAMLDKMLKVQARLLDKGKAILAGPGK